MGAIWKISKATSGVKTMYTQYIVNDFQWCILCWMECSLGKSWVIKLVVLHVILQTYVFAEASMWSPIRKCMADNGVPIIYKEFS